MTTSGSTAGSFRTNHQLTHVMNNVRRYLFAVLVAATFYSSQPATAQTRPESHVVAPGETLFGIARQYGLSVADLKAYNGLSASLIRPGQSLLLHAGGAPAGTSYVVKAGDTLWSISKQHGVTVETLRELNGLSGSGIRIGQTLVLEGDPELAAETQSGVEAPDVPPTADDDHVLSGELTDAVETELPSDSVVADQAEGATTDEVLAGGGKNAEAKPDVVIRIDDETPAAGADTYTVKSGDTWDSIAARYGMKADVIKEANGGREELPKAGGRIRIPDDPTVFRYTVEEGDTIERIARWFTVDASVIRRLNDLGDKDVTPGQVLRIPDLNSPLLETSKTSGREKKENRTDVDQAAREDQTSSQVRSDEPSTDVAPRADDNAVGKLAEDESAGDKRLDVRVYPDSFKGRLMANGNGYNPRRSTVSHPTYAFGTQVRVTNLSTGASAFAIVADRPIPGKNQVDLSRALARDLGINNSGDALVMIELVE